MTVLELKRFTKPVTRRDLASDPLAKFDTVDLGIKVHVANLDVAIKNGIARVKSGANVSSLDAHVAWVLFETFRKQPDIFTSDIRFWQWLTLTCYRDFAEARIGVSIPDIVKNEDFKRVLGSMSLNGMNRQVMWKLFLAGRALGSEDLVKLACSNQDRLVSIFERHIGKNPRIARALVKSVDKSGTAEIQKRITRINAIGESRLLDYLDETEIVSLCTQV